MPMRGFLRSLFSPATGATGEIPAIRQRERAFRALDDHALRAAFRDCTDVVEVVAIVTAVASRKAARRAWSSSARNARSRCRMAGISPVAPVAGENSDRKNPRMGIYQVTTPQRSDA